MPIRFNQQTGQLEDENGNIVPQGGPPTSRTVPVPFSSGLVTENMQGAPLAQAVAPPSFAPEPPQPMPVAAPPPAVPDGIAAPPPALPPGGMARTESRTTTTRTRELASKEKALAQGRVEADADEEGDLVRQQGEVKERQADARATGKENEAKALTADAKALDGGMQAGDVEIKAAKAKYDAELDKYAKMEPRDYYEGRTGLRVANALAVAFGELGRSLSKSGHNSALEIIQDAEQQHFAKERLRIEKQKDLVGQAKEGVASARVSKSDLITDLQLKSAARLTAFAKATEAAGERVGTPWAKLEGQRTAVALRADANKLALQAAQGLRQKISTTTETQSIQGTGVGGAGSKNNDTNVYGPDGKAIAQASTPKGAEKANDAIKAFRQMDDVLANLEQSYAKNGISLNPLSDAYAEQKALKSQAVIAYKNAAALGALSGPDMGLVEGGIGGAYTGATAVSKLKTARAAGSRSHAAALDSLGLPGKQISASMTAQPAAAAGVSDKFMNGAKIITQRNAKTGATRKAAQFPDGRIVPLE